MEWIEGHDDYWTNGGAPVLDYQVTYDQATDTYIVLETGILATDPVNGIPPTGFIA